MRKDEYVLTRELRRLEKYGLLFQAKRIGFSSDGGYKYDILFTEDKRVLEPGCDVSEILGIINSVETCINLYELSRGGDTKTSADDLTNSRQETEELFDRLKRLRLEYARTERVSAFCVFTNKTLTEMCEKLPTNEEEMLSIKGVGPKKLEKYGAAFIKIIAEYKSSNPITKNKVQSHVIADDINQKKEFYLNKGDEAKFEYKDLYYMFEIKEELNRICSAEKVKKISATRIWDYLASMGLVEEENTNGVHQKRATKAGIENGISNIEKEGKSGIHYSVVAFNAKAQRMIAEHYVQEMREQ